MSRKAANIISAQVIMKPDCVLGLATGSSPVGTYKQLIEWYEKLDLMNRGRLLKRRHIVLDLTESINRKQINDSLLRKKSSETGIYDGNQKYHVRQRRFS